MRNLPVICILFIICIACSDKTKTSNRCSDVLAGTFDKNAEMSDISAIFDLLPKEEKAAYNHFYRMVSMGYLDSVKFILESHNVDLSGYDKDNSNFSPIVFAASSSGNKELVLYLIDKGADPNAKTSGNETALHRAAWNGNLDMVKLLVCYGADLNLIYNANGGLSPLCCAAESGNIEVVKYLIEKGADVNYINEKNGLSPLKSAAYRGHLEIFKYLAHMLPDNYDWQEALFFGLNGGNLDIIKYVVEEKGADVNGSSKFWKGYPIEKAAHRYIVYKNNKPVDIVKYLVEKGARLSDINGGNVFPWAIYNSDEATIEYLITSGINVEIPTTEDGWTALALALDNNSFVLAKHLIHKTKDHTFRNKPLVVYFADGIEDSHLIIDFLIKEGVNKDYYTEALFNSIRSGDSISTHFLLDAGANIKALFPDTKFNILHFASDYRMAKFLIKRGAYTGNKAMLKEAWQNPPLLRALQEAGVYPPVSRPDMNKALADAAKRGDSWTVKYMLGRGANVNSYEDIPETEQQHEETIQSENLTQEKLEALERIREIEERNDPVYKQTPLIKNAIQGYSYYDHEFSYEGDKIQISPKIAEILLKAGADPNARDSRGKTALHYVSGDQSYGINIGVDPMGNRRDRERGGHSHSEVPADQYHDLIGKLLIEKGADLNAVDTYGDTPLIQAAKNRNSGMLKLLLNAGADLNIKNNIGNSLFEYLHDFTSLEIIKEAGLLNRVSQNNLNMTFSVFLGDYSRRNEYDINELKALINYGADVNSKMFPNLNALMFTFDDIHGDNKWEIAQVLIDNGIDLNTEDYQGFTLPMILIKNGKYKQKYAGHDIPLNLMFLLKNGIDLNYKSSKQYTILGMAICENRNDIVDLLIAHGAKRDLESEWWYTIIERRSDKETISKLRQLVKEGVDVNLQTPAAISHYRPELNQKGVTALMFFAAYDKEDVVKALLKMRANVKIKAEDGTTALSIAQQRGSHDMRKMLQ